MDLESLRGFDLDVPAIIRLLGKHRIIQTLDPKEIIQTLGVENVLETLFPNLTDEEKETLEQMRQRRAC